MNETSDVENLCEQDLIAQIADGCESALKEVYRRYGRVVYAVARRLLGDDGLAEDIVQDVVVRVWKHPLSFDPRRGTLRTFLVVLTRNRCIDVLRSQRSRIAREASDSTVIDLRPSAEEIVTAEEDVVGVKSALALLSDPQREVIQLAYFDGLTHRHIAKLLDIPEGTVKSRMRLGLDRLRAAVADEVRSPNPDMVV